MSPNHTAYIFLKKEKILNSPIERQRLSDLLLHCYKDILHKSSICTRQRYKKTKSENYVDNATQPEKHRAVKLA